MQLTYFEDRAAQPEAPAWEPTADDVHTLRHGYNLADVDRLARIAASRWPGLPISHRDRIETAWSAIAEAIYAAPDGAPPTPGDLAYAGQDAIGSAARSEMRHRGYDRHSGADGQIRGFTAWWDLAARVTQGPEERVTDRVALWQIWPQLTPARRGALLALAATGTWQGAAAAQGIAEKTLRHHVHAGRRDFLALWHQGEQPSAFWGADRRVYRAGAAAAPATYRKAAKAIRHRKPAVAAEPREQSHGIISGYNRGCRCAPCTGAKSAESERRRRRAGNAVRRQMTESGLRDVLARKAAGETWQSLAASTGFSESYLRSLKRGTATPVPDGSPAGTAAALCAATSPTSACWRSASRRPSPCISRTSGTGLPSPVLPWPASWARSWPRKATHSSSAPASAARRPACSMPSPAAWRSPPASPAASRSAASTGARTRIPAAPARPSGRRAAPARPAALRRARTPAGGAATAAPRSSGPAAAATARRPARGLTPIRRGPSRPSLTPDTCCPHHAGRPCVPPRA